MNIAHVLDSLEVGGMERLVVDLAQLQRHNGHNVYVFCMNTGGPLKDELERAGIFVDVYSKGSGFDWGYVKHLRKMFKKFSMDVIHTHNPYANLYGALSGKLAGASKVVNTRHGMGNFPYNKKREKIFKLSTLFTDHVACVCERARDRFVEMKICPLRKAHVVYNGINLKRYETLDRADYFNVRDELGIGSDDLIVGVVARLEPTKDIQNLIRAYSHVRTAYPQLKLMIVGDGREMENLKTLTRQLNIEEHVFFLGSRKDVPRLLIAMDVFVLPSISEGMSLTLIEAMAARKPIITTNVGGSPEVVVDQLTGILIEPERPEQIQEQLGMLIKHPSVAANFADNGRKRAFSLFNIETMMENYLKLYRS